ncbi:MAG TPA: NADH-quinone oxidoreductase subunit C [Bacteroidales bacterium]|jgi:Ni,Fe-hydrogenase III large subunit|nr:NADH-quinone oxidoreductase subunit C [Bacteroidales bacterium]HOL98266.1 NADH-quinone oxidoreductase subunit C [Bacteroidales bacterium]HOM36619.1 NADH-quinone oxidoreductase subunit C [Bacteroidales bacterium]HPD24045.1 NADH-quinone oxidoreductase subunit C [Bacteroidales bacterium]HRT00004.1 NADH-quinone oxidoreductase subunit C [Bacteroidales bacterium]
MKTIEIKNNETQLLKEIPELTLQEFYDEFNILNSPNFHCVNYFAVENGDRINLYSFIADDQNQSIKSFSTAINKGEEVKSLTGIFPGMHCYEREISERFEIEFFDSKYSKPLRFPYNRKNLKQNIGDFPFYEIESHELHEVGVGPIHAGIIEPGHFRFICNGEKVLHLEIQLGYQHRGIEDLFTKNNNIIYQTKLAESIAGDSVVANTLAFAQIIESLSNVNIDKSLNIERTVALELERIAIHTGDLSALCTDVAYQFGTVVFQDLRTIIINTFLSWCGNRFARKLLKPGDTDFPLNNEIKEKILKNLAEYESRFHEMAELMFNLPSVLTRFENVGVVTKEQAEDMMFVGMAARTCGLLRDIRHSHPFAAFIDEKINPVVLYSGDVMARAKLRYLEIIESLKYIKALLSKHDDKRVQNKIEFRFNPNSICLSLTEGWRGEICHVGITDNQGKISHYKIKDPSLHNWFALALAVRNNDISDFPICNKSFDLSYCGFDL